MRFTTTNTNTNPDHVSAELDLRDRLPDPAERRAIRERLGLSRAVLAADIGVAQETILHWESGTATPRRSNLRAYVELLGRLQAEIDARGEG